MLCGFPRPPCYALALLSTPVTIDGQTSVVNTSEGREGPVVGDFASTADFIRAFEAFHDRRTPSSHDVLERAARLASESMRAVNIQLRRVRSAEPEDSEWMSRVVMDCQFLVVALWRLRTAARIAASVDSDSGNGVARALAAFDGQLPELATMRHVGQHLDAYALDHPKRRRQRKPGGTELIGRRLLEVYSWSEDQFGWLRGTIDFGQAKAAAEALYASVRAARDEQ